MLEFLSSEGAAVEDFALSVWKADGVGVGVWVGFHLL